MGKTLWDINFSTLNVSNDKAFKAFGGKYTNSSNLTDGAYTADGEGDIPSFSINSVDIDWNGGNLNAAKPSEPTEGFPNGTVTTTGELLQNIANLQAQVDLLTTLVKGLYSALT